MEKITIYCIKKLNHREILNKLIIIILELSIVISSDYLN